MKSLWDNSTAKEFASDPLKMRVYSSRLLGKESSLVLHGGGNTSVKTEVLNKFGENEEILYVKGSGWDLSSIETKGFAPVQMKRLLQMATFETLSDTDMVLLQRSAMTDPYAPNPSVEAILHAIIPFRFVDHTHADAVVSITNSPNGQELIEKLYGNSVFIIPYIMPGFVLAKKIHDLTKNLDWDKIEGIVLLNHGVFTFSDNAKESYEKMIRIVNSAEEFIEKKNISFAISESSQNPDIEKMSAVRHAISIEKKSPVIVKWNTSPKAIGFSNLS